jgi:hypothetical protein
MMPEELRMKYLLLSMFLIGCGTTTSQYTYKVSGKVAPLIIFTKECTIGDFGLIEAGFRNDAGITWACKWPPRSKQLREKLKIERGLR